MPQYEHYERGPECKCGVCGADLYETDPRYEPTSLIVRNGSICVECMNQRLARRGSALLLKGGEK